MRVTGKQSPCLYPDPWTFSLLFFFCPLYPVEERECANSQVGVWLLAWANPPQCAARNSEYAEKHDSNIGFIQKWNKMSHLSFLNITFWCIYICAPILPHTKVPLIHGSDNHFSMKTRIFIWAINNLLFLNITRMLQFFLKLLNSSYTASSHAYHFTTQKMRIKTVTFLCLSILWNTTVLTLCN